MFLPEGSEPSGFGGVLRLNDVFQSENYLIEVTLKDATYEMNGATFVMPDFGKWHVLPKMNVNDCPHGEFVCLSCLANWATDYFIQIRAVDADGQTIGHVNNMPEGVDA